jgi:Fe-S cluster assembly iron-binding protein IscA
MRGLVFIVTFLAGLGLGTTVAWLLLRRLVTEAKTKASNALQYLTEQQEENLKLRSQVSTLTMEKVETTNLLADALRSRDRARKKLQNLRQQPKETTGVRVAPVEPIRGDTWDSRHPRHNVKSRAR